MDYGTQGLRQNLGQPKIAFFVTSVTSFASKTQTPTWRYDKSAVNVPLLKEQGQQMQKETKLISAIGTVTTLSGAGILWVLDGLSGLPSIGLLMGIGLGAIAITGATSAWLRSRHRRQIMGMRDSALW
jgi:hypothetical protein